MIHPKLENRNCFILQRCSSPGQAGTSLDNQAKSWESLIADNRIRVVGRLDLPGVTGSIPGARHDIDEIIRLKRAGLDFDLLLLPNTDRFTRAGSLHAGKMLWDLEGEGITVHFAAEGLFSDDQLSRTMLSFLFDAAQRTAMAISRSATMGVTNSYLEGRSPHTRRPPYGLDRMYSVDGVDVHRLRNLADGTQQMLDPRTDEVIRTFGANPRRGTPAHYIKQKNERVRFVPGDPLRVATVQAIFEQFYVRRASVHSIAKQLNDARVPSAHGTAWDWTVVKGIATNPVYVGLMIRGRTTRAIYYKAARGAPAEAGTEARELRDHPRPRLRSRPYEEWLPREDPALAEYLPEPVRGIARAAIEERFRAEASARPAPRASRDRHRGSDFFLKDVLHSKQGNWRMTGRCSGRGGEKRYYRVCRGQNSPRTGNVLARVIPAGPLEEAMLDVLRQVLLSKPDLSDAVRAAVADHAAAQARGGDRRRTEKELRRKHKQLAAALDSLVGDDEADRAAQAKLAEYRLEVARLSSELRSAPRPKPGPDVDAAASRLAQELHRFGRRLDGQDKAIVHEMLALLTERMEIDLETREADVVLSIPSWVGEALSRADPMGLDQVFAWRTPDEAQRRTGAFLARFQCHAEGRRPVCFKCRRVPKAA